MTLHNMPDPDIKRPLLTPVKEAVWGPLWKDVFLFLIAGILHFKVHLTVKTAAWQLATKNNVSVNMKRWHGST